MPGKKKTSSRSTGRLRSRPSLSSLVSSRRRNAIVAAFAVALIVSGIGVLQFDSNKVPSSHAATVPSGLGQYCVDDGHTCLNAWNGGPWIQAYPQPAKNNDFSVVPSGSGHYEIARGISGSCAGDAYNNSTNREVSLDNCPSDPYPSVAGCRNAARQRSGSH